MKPSLCVFVFAAIAFFLAMFATPGAAQVFLQPAAEMQTQETLIVDSAIQVLDEIMAIPVRAIPAALLADAEGIAIVPGLLKGGFIVGVRHGRGVLVLRDEQRAWRAPVFITITGGSIGYQIGVQSTDVVLVFKTKHSIQGLMNGKITLGADIAAAAGPVGRQAQAATDSRLKAEIYSYSRSRGLFAGVALDGAALQIDPQANAAYYAFPGPVGNNLAGQPQPIPPSALRLLSQIARYADVGVPAPDDPVQAIHLAPEQTPVDPLRLQRRLAESWRRLEALLDDRWKNYLALPPQIDGPQIGVSQETLQQALSRFQTVATRPEYQLLAQRPEFQETYRLLAELLAAQIAPPPLSLPAPPRDGR